MKWDQKIFVNNIKILIDSYCDKKAARFNEIIESRDAATRWKTPGYRPSFDILLTVTEKFDLSFDWLVTGKGSMRPGALSIQEQRELYNAQKSHCLFCDGMSGQVKDLCNRMKKIIESKHETAVPALISNIAAFEDSVKQTEEIKRQKEEIEELKKTVRHHSKLLQPEHHTGSGRAAGAGIRQKKT